MTRAAVGLAQLTVVVALAVSGCSVHSATPATAPSTVRSVPPTATPTAPAGGMEADPTAGTPAQQDPIAAATKVLLTWSRPSMSYEQWWNALEPLLNPQGQQDYAETDPSLIPALRVTGRPRLVASTVDTSATVWFPTSSVTYGAAEFGVRLSRRSGISAWLAAEIIFPAPAKPSTHAGGNPAGA